jgi:hypothetical protein
MKTSAAVMSSANFDAVHLSTPLDAPGAFPYVTRSRRNGREISSNHFVQELAESGFFAELEKAQ